MCFGDSSLFGSCPRGLHRWLRTVLQSADAAAQESTSAQREEHFTVMPSLGESRTLNTSQINGISSHFITQSV